MSGKKKSEYRTIATAVLTAVLLLTGCGTAEALSSVSIAQNAGAAVAEPVRTDIEGPPQLVLPPKGEELYQQALEASGKKAAPNPLPAEPVGTARDSSADALVDWSDAARGLVWVKYTGTGTQTIRVQLTRGEEAYAYLLPDSGWTVFPLSEGDGDYRVDVYENVSGSKYALLLSSACTVQMQDPLSPFLLPNQYVDYRSAPVTAALAEILKEHYSSTFESVNAVYEFVVEHMSYDRELAANVKGGYVPDLDGALEKRSGICLDYAGLMTALLRLQNIPCSLVTGYAGNSFHAWINVWSEETGWINSVIYFDGKGWQLMDPTFADSSSEKELQEYIGDGSNYTEKFRY